MHLALYKNTTDYKFNQLFYSTISFINSISKLIILTYSSIDFSIISLILAPIINE